jgi:osmotically-inducible protein OsmY
VREVWSEIAVAKGGDAVDVFESHEIRDGGRGLADAAWDVWLTTEVKLRLLANEHVSAFAVNVDTLDGVVTLFGTVPTENARRAAAETARGVSGVRSVADRLEIVPAAREAETEVRDQELVSKVQERIAARKDLSQAVVQVAVENRVARLTGTVPSNHLRLVAATAAGEVPGVRAVVVDLQIRRMTRVTAPS